jgi:hypothetical protein
MNSGVAPIQNGYKLKRKMNQMAIGIDKHEGKGDMLKSISLLKGND